MDCRFGIGDFRFPAKAFPPGGIIEKQSQIQKRQSKIGNPKSAIVNRQSKIEI